MKTSSLLPYALLSALPVSVLAATGDVLSTNGFNTCSQNATLTLSKLSIQFDRSSNIVSFNVAGTSTEAQNITAFLTASAYGNVIYQKEFDPCSNNTFVERLCPVPKGDFSAHGSHAIPQEYVGMIPSIAYTIPDLEGDAKLEIKKKDSNSNSTTDAACITSTISNQKTMHVPGVGWASAAVVGASLVVSGVGAMAAVGSVGGIAGAPGAHGGGGSSSPGFGEVLHWFQGMALNGMLSVQYPPVYRDFARNFGFSAGLIPWRSMQLTIDNFRNVTGGNLTTDSVKYLENSTLVYQVKGSQESQNQKRDLLPRLAENLMIAARDLSFNANGQTGTVSGGDNSSSTANSTSTDSQSKQPNYVQGIQGYVEALSIPKANTFMTVLLFFAVILAAVTAGILLFKLILEAWALFGKFPKKMQGFRKHYWWTLGKTLTNLVLLLYGVWVLYCVYQFKQGDSWAAKALAGVTLGLFTAVLLAFSWRIHYLARKFKKSEGDTSQLFEDKETWRKYSIFYDNYKRSYWWLFVPVIIYMFARGCVIAGADGHGLAQTAGQLIVESLMLLLLLFLRPYTRGSGNWINLVIQAVRVISVVCILVFVEELGFSQTTKTVTGVVLIAVQAGLTGVLAILIAINAIINCCRMNPHRRQRKQQEKFHRDFDSLTPLDSHNSLLMDPVEKKGMNEKSAMVGVHTRGGSKNGYDMLPHRDESQDRLIANPSNMGSLTPKDRSRSPSPDIFGDRQPALPSVKAQTQPTLPNLGQQRQPSVPDVRYMGRAL